MPSQQGVLYPYSSYMADVLTNRGELEEAEASLAGWLFGRGRRDRARDLLPRRPRLVALRAPRLRPGRVGLGAARALHGGVRDAQSRALWHGGSHLALALLGLGYRERALGPRLRGGRAGESVGRTPSDRRRTAHARPRGGRRQGHRDAAGLARRAERLVGEARARADDGRARRGTAARGRSATRRGSCSRKAFGSPPSRARSRSSSAASGSSERRSPDARRRDPRPVLALRRPRAAPAGGDRPVVRGERLRGGRARPPARARKRSTSSSSSMARPSSRPAARTRSASAAAKFFGADLALTGDPPGADVVAATLAPLPRRPGAQLERLLLERPQLMLRLLRVEAPPPPGTLDRQP